MAVAQLMKLGLAKELTWAEAAAPKYLVPITARWFSEPTGQLLDQGVRGIRAADYAAYQGVRHPEITLEGAFFPEECGFFLHHLLGTRDYGATVASGTTGGTVATALNGATAAGATTVTVVNATGIAVDMVLAIDSGNLLENRKVVAINGTVITLDIPLTLGHSNGAGVADVTAPFTHTWTLENQANSLTVQIEDGVESFRAVGMRCHQVQLNFNAAEGLVAYSANFSGARLVAEGAGYSPPGAVPADATGAATRTLFEGWRGTVTMGGVAFTRLISMELTFQNEPDIKYTFNNRQEPCAIYVGRLEVTARLTVNYTSLADLNLFRNKTQQDVAITLAKTAGGVDQQLQITMSAFDYGDAPAEVDMGGIGEVLTLTGRALYNAADAGPCVVMMKNTKHTYAG